MKRLVGVVLLGCWSLDAPVVACQCGQSPDATQAVSLVPIVVAGRADVLREERISGLFSKKIVKLTVERVWKGNPPPVLELVVGLSDCDYTQFKTGESYLVFVEAPKDQLGAWSASKCRPTMLLREAGTNLALLGRGQVRTPASAPADNPIFGSVRSALMVLLGAAGASLVLLLVIRRLRASN